MVKGYVSNEEIEVFKRFQRVSTEACADFYPRYVEHLKEHKVRIDYTVTADELQERHHQWVLGSFGAKYSNNPSGPFLGVIEEIGELSHALLKANQNIRGSAEKHALDEMDAYGDIFTYTINCCTELGLDLDLVVRPWSVHPRTKNESDRDSTFKNLLANLMHPTTPENHTPGGWSTAPAVCAAFVGGFRCAFSISAGDVVPVTAILELLDKAQRSGTHPGEEVRKLSQNLWSNYEKMMRESSLTSGLERLNETTWNNGKSFVLSITGFLISELSSAAREAFSPTGRDLVAAHRRATAATTARDLYWREGIPPTPQWEEVASHIVSMCRLESSAIADGDTRVLPRVYAVRNFLLKLVTMMLLRGLSEDQITTIFLGTAEKMFSRNWNTNAGSGSDLGG